jgi:hypothetical protein
MLFSAIALDKIFKDKSNCFNFVCDRTVAQTSHTALLDHGCFMLGLSKQIALL